IPVLYKLANDDPVYVFSSYLVLYMSDPTRKSASSQSLNIYFIDAFSKKLYLVSSLSLLFTDQTAFTVFPGLYQLWLAPSWFIPSLKSVISKVVGNKSAVA